MYVEIGRSGQQKCIGMKNVISEIREEFCLALPALHCLQEIHIPVAFTESGKLRCWKSS